VQLTPRTLARPYPQRSASMSSLGFSRIVDRVCVLPPRSWMPAEIAGRDQQNAPPTRTGLRHSAPSHPPTARGRPNAAVLCFTPARRTLVAALTSRAAHPRAPNSRMHAVTRLLQIAPADGPVSRGNLRATAGTVNSARSHPDVCCSLPEKPRALRPTMPR
jgi:hypothetical protein